MKALDQKLRRDLVQMSGQALTIALVVACGIASYIATKGTYYSLRYARDSYYQRYRFADVFAELERAPESLRSRIETIPGVARVESRIVEPVSVPIEGAAEPAIADLISVAPSGQAITGGIALRAGRIVEPGRTDEVVLLEAFARAHGLRVGSRLPAVLAGIRRELRVVGIALSPEYVFSVAPGSVNPDPRRFCVLWMDRAVMASAFHMEGAFNSVLIHMQKGGSEPAVIDAVNRALATYGGRGAYSRSKQLSDNTLHSRLERLETLTKLLPTIFLGVAAFLINVVLSRVVQLERGQIAVLKAIGYREREIGLHYLKLVCVIVFLGWLVGVGAGDWLGGLMTGLFTKYFHFPSVHYRLEPRLLVLASAISLAAAVAGALGAVWAVMRLPPAAAMRPQAPTAYRHGLSERLPIARLFGLSMQMVVREIERKPLRAVLSALGVAMAVAVLIAGRFNADAIDWFIRVQFELAQREDMDVTFRRPLSERAIFELTRLPGVRSAESLRGLAVRYRFGARSRESLLFGHPERAELRRVIDRDGRLQPLPKHGVLASAELAQVLGFHAGDSLTLEVLEGKRGTYRVFVAGLVDDIFGLYGHMRDEELNRMLGAEPMISMALLRVDPLQRTVLERDLTARPEVLGVNRFDNIVTQFREQTAAQMQVTTLILTIFAVIIASGVIYNNARVALSTRSRDLASLRVLGFRRSEIATILLGELSIQVMVALLPGMLLGRALAQQMMASADREMYRFPVMISARTYAFAAVVTLLASLASALLVRDKLDHLDLIGVLKSRE